MNQPPLKDAVAAQLTKLNQIRGHPVNVDLIRAVAMFGVILLHASGRFTITPQELAK